MPLSPATEKRVFAHRRNNIAAGLPFVKGKLIPVDLISLVGARFGLQTGLTGATLPDREKRGFDRAVRVSVCARTPTTGVL